MKQEFLKIRDDWYKKGYNAGRRKNKSGCCCIIDDKQGVVSVCGEHEQWRDKGLEPLKQLWEMYVCSEYDEGARLTLFEIDLLNFLNKLAKKFKWYKEQNK